MIDREVEDVIETSNRLLADSGVSSVEEVRREKSPLIQYSAHLTAANGKLRQFLYARLYWHPEVKQVNERACEMLRNVFDAYLQNPKWLGEQASKRIRTDGLHRTVCDYLSGMTDRYLIEEHHRLFPNHPGLPARG
jgi:dGTPase